MSYLNIQDDMYLVYELKKDKIRYGEESIEATRRLSLDESSPYGIKCNHGLFASDEWWRNVENGTILTKIISGEILEVFEASMDHTGVPDSFNYIDENGAIREAGIQFLKKKDRKLFVPKKKVMIFYVFNESKTPDDSYPKDNLLYNHIRLVLEMAISI